MEGMVGGKRWRGGWRGRMRVRDREGVRERGRGEEERGRAHTSER